jgi:REP element-mobilizing transposase RayT
MRAEPYLFFNRVASPPVQERSAAGLRRSRSFRISPLINQRGVTVPGVAISARFNRRCLCEPRHRFGQRSFRRAAADAIPDQCQTPAYAASMKKPVQLEFPPRGHGGARPGAGRPKSDRVSHHGRAGEARPTPYHFVWHTVEGVSSLRGRKLFREVQEAFRRCHEKEGFRVVLFSVQSNHVHAMAEGDDVQPLSRGMQGLGVSMAKRINRVSGRRGRVFDDRFFARALPTPREVANALDYVLRNDQIHERRMGIIIDRGQEPDPFSSAALPEDPPLTSPPTIWLLTTGWRRAKPTRVAS